MANLYLDCSSGISGDMLVGALLDLGMPLSYLKNQLSLLRLQERFELAQKKVRKAGILATQFSIKAVIQKGRRYKDIKRLIETSRLSPPVKARALHMFGVLAQIEGKIHGVKKEEVHFHEVGALDSIIDIVAIATGMDYWGITALCCGVITTGSGIVSTAHGVMAIPSPATEQLLKGFKVRFEGTRELVTPTGALVLSCFADQDTTVTYEKVGYGAGTYDLPHPNVLRAYMGAHRELGESIVVLECTMDDYIPQTIPNIMDRLREHGAVDTWWQWASGKHGRPAIVLSVLCGQKEEDKLIRMLIEHSSSIGVRRRVEQRRCMERDFIVVHTPYGKVRIKRALADGKVVNALPEYRDCVALAEKKRVPIKKVYYAAIASSRNKNISQC